jgi:hypothetical protein
MTGEMINVAEQPSYTFAASPDDEEIRFELHFMTTVGIISVVDNSNVYIYSSGNSVYVRSNENIEAGSIKVFNIAGLEILAKQLEGVPLNKIDLSAETGYYVVQVTTNDKVYSQKVFIR